MQACVYCNAPLQPGTPFCGTCGRMQPEHSSDALTRVQPLSGPAAPSEDSRATLEAAATRRCPTCGSDVPANASACSYCGQLLNPLGSQPIVASGDNLTPPPPPVSGPPMMPGDASAPTLQATGSGPGMSGPWGPTQPGAPSGPWTPPPGWSGSQQPGGWMPPPVGSGNIPGGSQLWQQPAVGWQPGGSQPWQGVPIMPPPGVSGPGGRKTDGKKIALIVGGILAGVILLVAAAGLLYALTRPNPSITVTSATTSGSLPSGSPDKSFHVTGQKFSSNEAITLLLDGKSAPGAPIVRSDGSGNFTQDLTITDDWLVGRHTLTAHDTSGYATKNPAQLQIVAAPVITVKSQYQAGSGPAGSSGTSFDITGKRFPPNVAVTFQLDGKPVPNTAPTESDAQGKLATQLSVTAAWGLGNHTVTASDPQGDTTAQAQPVVVVHQGEAGTPGPNGAPADNANFTVNVSGSATQTNGNTFSFTNTLKITGQPDPAGGTVCAVRDDGQPHTFNGTLLGTGEAYTETLTFSCSGSYKNGHLTYTETATSGQTTLSGGGVCVLNQPFVFMQLDGTFTSSSQISGSYREDYSQENCNARYAYLSRDPSTGSWDGSEY